MGSPTQPITGRLIVAGRVLVGIGLEDLTKASGVPLESIRQFESSGSAWLPAGADVEAITRALEKFGAVFIEEGHGLGAGVRLKFTRSDVRQIVRLEGEGGIARSDDVP